MPLLYPDNHAMAALTLDITLTPKLDVAKTEQILQALRTSLGGLGTSIQPLDPKALAGLDAADDSARRLRQELESAGEAAAGAGGKMEQAGNRAQKAFAFNNLVQQTAAISGALNDVVAIGAKYESSLAAVGAITGLAGEQLDALGQRAIDLSLKFGGSATDQLASFQGVLSKFGANVADSPAALGKLADNISTLSAASGDSAAQSMAAVTDAMLQFGLVTGDANKDAETSTRVINALAASAQVGAAEIPQVAQAVLQAGVAAKGANLSFESTNAALQVLAVGGKVGSEAGVALRNVLGLLQNASGPAEVAMKKLGTSTKELGQLLTTQGLDAALQKVRIGMNALGSDAERNATLMEIFGTENSAAAGILLENVPKFKEFQDGIIAGQQGLGAAFEQANTRMATAETGMARARAFVESQFISISGVIGTTFSSALGATAQLAPTITTLSGLKDVFPTGLVSQFGTSVKDVVVPALLKLGVLRATSVATTAAETAADVANTVAKTGQAVATTGATTAQYALNTAMLANPIFLLVAGIGAAVAAYAIFSKGTKDLGTATEDANKALEEFNAASAGAAGAAKAQTELQKLGAEYEQLRGKTDPESQKRFAEVSEQLAQTVPEAAVAVDKLNAAGQRVGTAYDISTQSVRAFADEQARIAQQQKADALANLTDQSRALGDSLHAAVEEQKSLREEQARLQALQAQGLGDASGLGISGDLLDTVDEQLKEINAELSKQAGEIQKASPELEKQVQAWKAQGLSVEQIANRTNLTVEEVRRYGGQLDTASLGVANLDAALRGVGAAQAEVVRQVAQQATEYKAAQAEVAKLKSQIAAKQQLGVDTKELESKLREAEESARGKELKLRTTTDTEEFKKTFAAIPDAARQQLGEIPGIVKTVSDNAANEARQAKVGEAFADAATIKGDLDKQNQLGQLVEKFKAAKTEAERNSIAAQIARDVPSAISGVQQVVDANGKIATQYEINAEAAQGWVDAQVKGAGEKLGPMNRLLIDQIQQQAKKYDEGRASLAKLGAEITETNKKGGDVSALTARYTALQKEVNDSGAAVAETVKQGQKVGLLKGDIEAMATGFGKSKEEAKNLAAAVQSIPAEVQTAVRSVAELAAEYNKTKAALSSGLQTNLQAGTQLLFEGKAVSKEMRAEIDAAYTENKRLEALYNSLDPAARERAASQRSAKLKQEAEAAAKFAESIAKEELKRQEETIKAVAGIENAAIQDKNEKVLQGLQAEKAAKLRGVDAEQAALEERLRDLQKHADRLGDTAKQQLLQQADALRAQYKSTAQEVDAQARELAALDAAQLSERLATLGTNVSKRLLVLLEYYQKQGATIAAANADVAKQLLAADQETLRHAAEQSKALAATLGENTAQEIRSKTAASIAALRAETRAQLEGLLSQNEAFVAEAAKIADLPTAERARALQTIIDDFLADAAPGGPIATAIAKMNAEIQRLTTEAQTKADLANEQARIAAITNRAEREREQKLLEARKTYIAELAAAGENEEKQNEAAKRYRAAALAATKEYELATNKVLADSIAITEALQQRSRERTAAAEKDALEEKKKKLQEEREALEQSLRDGIVSREKYLERLTELSHREAEVHAATEQTKFVLGKVVAESVLDYTSAYAEAKDRRIEASTTKLQALAAQGQGFTAEAGAAQLDLLQQQGEKTLAQLTDASVKMLAAGEFSVKALGNIILDNAFQLAKSQILIYTPTIYAAAASMLGPIFGPIAATVVLGVVQAGMAAAQSALRFNAGGVVPGNPADGDVVPALLTPGERIFTVETSRRESPLFQALASGTSSDEYFRQHADAYIGTDGRLRVGALEHTVAEQAAVVGQLAHSVDDLTATVATVAERQSRGGRSQHAFRHQFGPLTVSGRDLVAAFRRTETDSLSR